MTKTPEALIVLILFLVQFIDVLDFMVVMPLGPDFAKNLGIAESNLGWLASSYTLAAAFSGILTSTFIDRFERKIVLTFALTGLSLANIFSANAWNIESMLISRFLAGAFGGPATSLCFAIVADLFDDKKRGSVMGKIMSGFSLAAIFGVPMGLEMSTRFGWASSFYMVSALTIIAIILITCYLPKITIHLSETHKSKVTYLSLFNKSSYVLSFIVVAIGSIASFMIIPSVSPFLQSNLDYPRSDIGNLYFIGGIGSFFALHIAGKLADKTSSTFTIWTSNVFILFSLIAGMIFIIRSIPVLVIFVPFMIGMAIRNVSSFTLYSKVPTLRDRAGFMSIISCFQHLASALGAILAALILVEVNDQLKNIEILAIIASILFIIAPFILNAIEKKIAKARAHEEIIQYNEY